MIAETVRQRRDRTMERWRGGRVCVWEREKEEAKEAGRGEDARPEQMRGGSDGGPFNDETGVSVPGDHFSGYAQTLRTFLAGVLRAIWVPALAAAGLVCPPAPRGVLLLGRLRRHGVVLFW